MHGSPRAAGGLSRTDASSLAEFAISLPLLVVLVVGIFDFGGAFNQKQQLSNAMREAARFGASQPTNDITPGTAPPSVDAIRYVVAAYLSAARLSDCGLASVAPPSTGPPWTYQSTGNCPSPGLTLVISRDPNSGANTQFATCVVIADTFGNPNPIANLYMPCTNVHILYSYQWRFNSVIQLLVPGASLGLSQINADATVVNTN